MLGKHYWLKLLVVVAIEIITSSKTTYSFQVQCDFGTSNSSSTTYAAIGELTSHFGDARSCKINHDYSGIVRVHLSKQTHNLSIIYTIVLEKKEIIFVGTAHYKDLMLGPGYHFHACPSLQEPSQSSSPDLDLFMFGTPANSTFKVDIKLDKTSLSAGESKTIEVQKNGMAQVLAFDVDEKNLFKLLQVSVSSDDDKISYLAVSQSCTRVQRQGVGMQSHTTDQKLITLSFTKYGRITLSQYSVPKIQAGRWYIGVLVQKVSVGSIEKKTVNVSVTQTYSYDTVGKGLPVLYMCLITGILGILIAIFAHFFLNSDFDEMDPPYCVDDDDTPVDEEAKFKSALRHRFPRKSIAEFMPQPIPRKRFPYKMWMKVVCVHWFGRGTKTYSYLTVLLAVSFLVGSAQFVIGRWSNMVSTGDRDKCYYNDRCYRPIAFADLPSNFMISNVPYCILGVILAVAFSFREAICLNHRETSLYLQSHNPQDVPYDFSLAYALSWALLFEGLFSATYHLCPSRLTFQFDSAFMFIISGLVVIALFNARIEKIKDGDKRPPDETIVQAPKYFLFFVAPLLVLNYVGSIRDTDGLPRFVEGLYWIVLVLWLILVYVWAVRKVGVSCCRGSGCAEKSGCTTWEDRVKWFWLILVPVCLFIIGMKKLEDWSQFFLFSCVAAVVLSIAGIMSMNVLSSLRRLNQAYRKMEDGESICDAKAWCLYFLKNTHRIIFIIALFLFWVFAMYFFKLKPTAKKVALPSVSRTFNEECVLWDFFDYHDIWHMLSSIALYMSAFLLIYITRSVEKRYWVEAIYWKSKTYPNSHRKVDDISRQSPDKSEYDDTNGIELREASPSPTIGEQPKDEGTRALLQKTTGV